MVVSGHLNGYFQKLKAIGQLARTLNDHIGQCSQCALRWQATGMQGGVGLLAQISGVGLRLLQPHQRHIGRLIVRSVFAGSFAQCGRVSSDVQNIVHYLKRQSERRAIRLQRRQRRCIGLTASRAHHHAALQQSASFEAVHLAQLRLVQRQPDTGQVNRLTAGHAR